MTSAVLLDPTRTGHEARALDETLRRLIVGQDEAIDQIVNIYQMHLTGMNPPGRPVGNLLFLGPTGSGKTRIVEAVATGLAGNAKAVIKIDCGEFQHSHEIAKLIGSPPGYLGHRETHPLLSQETLNQYHTDEMKLSFVLFDEIEKASDALWNLLLGILDKATLTLGDNRRVDFSQAMIFLTSNLGASEMNSLMNPKLGFGAMAGAAPGSKLGEKVAKSGVEAARKKFAPEFFNRLDKVVVFRALGDKELRRILDIELGFVQERVMKTGENGCGFLLTVEAEAKDVLLRAGTDMKYGARHLKRAIERMLVQPLSNLIATQQARSGDLIRVSCDAAGRDLTFHRDRECMTPFEMAKLSGNEAFIGAMAAAPKGFYAEAARTQAPALRPARR